MAYTATEPDYTLRVTIEYEDETGYQWRRTNTSQPKRIGQETATSASAPGQAILAGAAMTVPNYTYPYHLGLQRVRFIVDAALRVGVLVSRRGRFRRG